MQLSQQTYEDKATSKRRSWSGRVHVQACNYPSRLMKTKQCRSDGHGLGIVHVQACDYPCSLMRQNNDVATVMDW